MNCIELDAYFCAVNCKVFLFEGNVTIGVFRGTCFKFVLLCPFAQAK